MLLREVPDDEATVVAEPGCLLQPLATPREVGEVDGHCGLCSSTPSSSARRRIPLSRVAIALSLPEKVRRRTQHSVHQPKQAEKMNKIKWGKMENITKSDRKKQNPP